MRYNLALYDLDRQGTFLAGLETMLFCGSSFRFFQILLAVLFCFACEGEMSPVNLADSGPTGRDSSTRDASQSTGDANVVDDSSVTDAADSSTSDDASVTGDHPFPFSFNDAQFFADVSPHAPTKLGCGETLANASITEHQEPAAINNDCNDGTTTVRNVRLGGDLGENGDVREGYRCDGSGTMNIESSWLESKGMGDDHADVIQCYHPNNSPTAKMNIRNTTIRAYDSSATAGIFVADAYALDLTLEDVMFWGGPFGLRFHTDERPGTVSLNNVCFYGTGDNDHSFRSDPFLFNPYPPEIVEWNNVYWCTIEDGKLVKHGEIPKP